MAKISSKKHNAKSGETITIRSATAIDADKMHMLGMAVFKSTDYLVATAEESGFSFILK